MVVVISENQRWFFGTWSARHLLPFDPMRYAGLGDAWPSFPHDLAPPGGSWVSEWTVDHGDGDARGWRYAFDFPDFKFRPWACGTQTVHCYVRRRRWVREWINDDSVVTTREVSEFIPSRRADARVDMSLCASGFKTTPGDTSDDVKKKIDVVTLEEDDDNEPQTPLVAALGRIYVRPTALDLHFETDDERDLYARTRVRSPKDNGAGWIATTWATTDVVEHFSKSSLVTSFQGGVSCVAIANPRSRVDVQVCDADSHAEIASCSFSAFDCDHSIHGDAAANFVDGPLASVVSMLFGGGTTTTKEDPPSSSRENKVSSSRALTKVKTGGKRAFVGEIHVDAVFETSYVDLCWRQRRGLPMGPENPSELSATQLKNLVDRAKKLVEPALDVVRFLRSFVDWRKRPKRTALSYFIAVSFQSCLDATRVLAVIPLAVVLFLLVTLHRRASGAWASSWIHRTHDDAIVPCFQLPSSEGKKPVPPLMTTPSSSKKKNSEDERRRAATVKIVARRIVKGDTDLVVRVRYAAPETLKTAFVADLDLDDGNDETPVISPRAMTSLPRENDDDDVEKSGGWLRRCAKVSDGTIFDDEAMDSRVDAAAQNFIAPWSRDGRTFRRCARFPVLTTSKKKSPDGAMVIQLYRRRRSSTREDDASSSSSKKQRRYLLRSASTDVIVRKLKRKPDLEEEVLLGEVRVNLDTVNGDVTVNVGGVDLVVAIEVVMPDFSEPTTEALVAEEQMLSRIVDRLKDNDDEPQIDVDDDVDDVVISEEEEEPSTKEEEKDSEDFEKKQRRGPIGEIMAARNQVLDVQATALRCISYLESFVNLLCWVQPAKTFLVLMVALAAAMAFLVVPLHAVVMAATTAYYYDEWMKSQKKDPGAKAVVDERMDNLIRSVPDAADLAEYFGPRTRTWLRRDRVGLIHRHLAPFAGTVLKTSGVVTKTWQRRYVLIDHDRRLLWWDDATIGGDYKGLRYLAPHIYQLKAQAAIALAPKGIMGWLTIIRFFFFARTHSLTHSLTHFLRLGYHTIDRVVPYAASDLPGGGGVATHYLQALDDDDLLRLRRAILGNQGASLVTKTLAIGSPPIGS